MQGPETRFLIALVLSEMDILSVQPGKRFSLHKDHDPLKRDGSDYVAPPTAILFQSKLAALPLGQGPLSAEARPIETAPTFMPPTDPTAPLERVAHPLAGRRPFGASGHSNDCKRGMVSCGLRNRVHRQIIESWIGTEKSKLRRKWPAPLIPKSSLASVSTCFPVALKPRCAAIS